MALPFAGFRFRRAITLAIHAFFDDSRVTHSEHVYECLVGFASNDDNWNAFDEKWQGLLIRFNIPFMHTSDFLAGETAVYADIKKRYTAVQRLEILREFIGVIRSHVFFGVAVAIDATAYRDILQGHKKPSTTELCFQRVLRRTLTRVQTWPNSKGPLLLIFDDSQASSGRVLNAYHSVRAHHVDFRNEVQSITFADARQVLQVQAADVFACAVSREFRSDALRWQKTSPFYDFLLAADGVNNLPYEEEFWNAEKIERHKSEIIEP